MEVVFAEEKQSLIIKIIGEIDHHTSADIKRKIDRAFAKSSAKHMIFDFSAVMFMDSSGIGLILGRVRLYKFWKGHVVLTGLSANVSKMVELSGIGSIAVIEKEAG